MALYQNFLWDYIEEQRKILFLPIEPEFANFYIPMDEPAKFDSLSLVKVISIDDITSSINNGTKPQMYASRITYDSKFLNGVFVEYEKRLYFIPKKTLEVFGNGSKFKGIDQLRMLWLLNAAISLRQKKMLWFCIENSNEYRCKIVKSITLRAPETIPVQDIEKEVDLDHMESYEFKNNMISIDVSKGKVSTYKKVERITIESFQKVQSNTFLVRKDGAQLMLPETLAESASDELLNNPRQFVKDFKYIKNYITDEDINIFPTESIDANEFVELLFDLSKKKDYLKQPAKGNLQKCLGEILAYV